MSDLLQDLRFAIRTLRKNAGFTAVVVVTLSVGIGANTAIYGILDQLLIRSLPVHEPERLVVLDGPGPFSGSTHNNSADLTPLSHPMFEGIRDRSEVFSSVLAHYTTAIHLTAGGSTENVRGDLVSGTYFATLGVEARIGRVLEAGDDVRPGGHPVVVLSHGFWSRRFAESADVLGQTVRVNGIPMTVVGVAERGFHGVEVGNPIDVFVPLQMQPQVIPTWRAGIGDWRTRWLTLMARLRDGVSLERARAGANLLYQQLLREDLASVSTQSESFRERFVQKELTLLPGGRGTSSLRAQSGTPLLVLMGMVGLVLLIACANVANLLLARASARRREIALRVAIGASRKRLARQLLVESLLLAVAGGLLGLVLATWTSDLLLRSLPDARIQEVFSSEPEPRVLAFALFLSLATGLLFGSVPALHAARSDAGLTLKNETGTLSGRSSSARFRSALVVVQVALSLLLLIGASLFVRSLRNLSSLDPGFEPERLIVFSVDPSLNGYELERRMQVLDRIRDGIAAEPGIRSVSLAEVPLMTNSNWSSTVRVEGYEPEEGENMNPNGNGVAPDFFDTLGMPLVAGRDFTDADVLGAPRVAVVNEDFARYFYQDQDPLGRRFAFGRNPDWVTIVGVVRDGKSMSLREEPARFVYFPYTQSNDLGGVTFYVRTELPPESLQARAHDWVSDVDPMLPVTELRTMERQIHDSLFAERMVAALSVAFGVLATLLAAIGVYGVLAYAVSLRTREIGIRLALGAERASVLLLVLKSVAALALVGVGLGLPLGYAAGRIVESQLYGLSGRDPAAILFAIFVLLAAAFAAGSLPALRASRVSPTVALRHE